MNKERTQDLTGAQFGSWSVIRFHGYDKHRDAEWFCRCSCGVEKPVKATYLLRGTSRKCKTCAIPKRIKLDTLPHSFWSNVERNAKKRGIALDVTKECCYSLFVKQGRKCALSGLDLYIAQNESEHMEGLTTASIDRIDSSIGYTENNIQWIHKDINFMKNSFDQRHFIRLCEMIVATSRGDLPDGKPEVF